MQYLAWSYQACGQEEVAHLATATGDGRTVGTSDHHCSPALCSGAGLSGGGKIAPGGTHRPPFAPGRSGGRSGSESTVCPLVPGCGVLRMEQPGCGDLSLLSRDRQPAPGALLGGAGRDVWLSSGLSSPGVGYPGTRDRSRVCSHWCRSSTIYASS